MKKRLCILLLALCVLLLVPHIASANAPAPEPDRMTVKVKYVPDQTEMTVLVAGDDGVFREKGAYSVSDGDSFAFYRTDGETQFCVEYVNQDGVTMRSNAVPLVRQGEYTYRADRNSLSEGVEHSGFWYGLGYLALYLIAAVGGVLLAFVATLVIELLTGLCFRMKPVRYVLFANLITNPAMNVVLLLTTLVTGGSGAGYWITLAVLEALAVFVEIVLYRKWYRGAHSTKRIVLFAIVANVLSCAAGVALNLWLF